MNSNMVIATRGSALALAQAQLVIDQCRKLFPRLRFEMKIFKTTGDKLQSASLAKPGESLPKGLFTKELEVALVRGKADLAVHSLKDLPTELPSGLMLGAVSKRADPRDVLIVRDEDFLRRRDETAEAAMDWSPGQSALKGLGPGVSLKTLPTGACLATSSPRRQAQIRELRPDLRTVEIRGNVVTRLQKLAEQGEIDGLVLAAAGLERLQFTIRPDGMLAGDAVPDGLRAVVLDSSQMLPCVGQAALGIEVRAADERIAPICERLNHFNTRQCVLAERAFLNEMGGGCQAPVAALGEIASDQLKLRAVSFAGGEPRRGERRGSPAEAESMGRELARELKPGKEEEKHG